MTRKKKKSEGGIRLAGRPLKYETPEDLVAVIEEYLNTTDYAVITVTGLARVVGSKQLLQDYEKREGYADIVKEAKLIIEESYETALRTNGGANNIFALKNFGWKDKSELGVSGDKENPLKMEIEFVEP